MALIIYGCSKKEELIGHSPWEFSPGLQPDGCESKIIALNYIKAAYKGTPQYFYWRHKKKNGEEIDTDVTLHRIEWGKEIKLQAIIKDITAQKRLEKNQPVEKTTGNREELFRNLVENMPVGVYKSTQAGKFLEVNPALVKMLGYDSREELLAIDIKQQIYFDPVDREKIIAEHKENELVLVRLKKKNGEEIWVEDFRWFYSDDEGKIAFHEGMVHDVTSRVRTESALKKTEEKFRFLAEYSPNMIFINIKGKVVYANSLCESIMEYTKEELYSPDFDFMNLVAPESHMQVREAFNCHFQGKEVPPYEYHLLSKLGKRLYAVLNTKLISYGDEQAILGVVTDITNLKTVELTLKKQTEELKNANATKDKFFSIIAHDLKNPFNTILGFARILGEEYQTFSDEEVRKCIDTIKKTAEQAYGLLENLLIWARAQTGSIEFLPQVFNLSKNISDAICLLDNMAKNKSVGITYNAPDHCFVFADENMISTIIRNLLTNAIKFSIRGGNIHVLVINQNDCIQISVIDSGIGIPISIKESLFRIDKKISTIGTENEKGSGLGLMLCKEFIEKHGGKIWVESEPDKGSRFTFTIPVILPDH